MVEVPNRLKSSQVEQARIIIAKKQGNKCDVCGRPFNGRVVGCLDHDHKTGFIRGVLCRACNRLEGQVLNRARMAGGSADPVTLIRALADYWQRHKVPQTKYLHPSYKTEEEKRLERNRKARVRRAAAKKEAE